MGNELYDVVIVGGGVMGSSTAYNLMHADNRLKVSVVEMDPTYARASTALSMANARIQFSLKENIQISQYALEVLEGFEESMAVGDETLNIAYHREGNLFVIDENGVASARKALELQQSLNCRVEWWTPEEVRIIWQAFVTNYFLTKKLRPMNTPSVPPIFVFLDRLVLHWSC